MRKRFPPILANSFFTIVMEHIGRSLRIQIASAAFSAFVFNFIRNSYHYIKFIYEQSDDYKYHQNVDIHFPFGPIRANAQIP